MAMNQYLDQDSYSLGSGFQTQASPTPGLSQVGIPQTTPQATPTKSATIPSPTGGYQGADGFAAFTGTGVPTWMDSYKPWQEYHVKTQGGQDMNRGWDVDEDSRKQKQRIDDNYLRQLQQYNQANGTNIQPDPAVLGVGAQPNKFTPTDHSGDGLLGGISRALGTDSSNSGLGRLGKELTSNPTLNALMVGAGSVFGGPAGAAMVNGTISRAQGNDWGQVASNAAGAGLGSWGVGQFAPGLSGGGTEGLQSTFSNLMGSGTSVAPELTGMPIESGGFVGGGAGASSAASSLPALTGMPIESGGFVSAAPGATAAGGAGTTATSLATSNVGKVLGSILGNGGGIRDLAQAAGTIWSAGKGSESATQNQSVINNQIKSLTDMFGQDSPYAKMLRQTLERKDAAAGRNSQYGNRETQLQALLAEKALQSSGAIGNLAQQSSALDNSVNAGRNTQLNALDSILNKTGVYDWTKDWAKDGLSSLFGG